jgi:hypothetical protein
MHIDPTQPRVLTTVCNPMKRNLIWSLLVWLIRRDHRDCARLNQISTLSASLKSDFSTLDLT